MRTRTRRIFSKTTKVAAVVFAALLFTSACSLVHKQVETEKLLTPLSEANPSDLISVVNKLVGLRSIRGRVDIQFEDTSFATSGIAEKYRTADGSILIERPGKVYLAIQGPLAIDIATMTSDGEHFRIAILKGDEKYRRFVKGTNNAVYPKLEMDDAPAADKKAKSSSEAKTVNALSNLRPQHLTEALLIRPIDGKASGVLYAQSEFFESEKDPTKTDSNKRVVRGYYLLDELQPGADNSARLLRRFWFDRVGGIRLARLQSFDEKGVLVNDVTYGPLTKFGAEGEGPQMPAKISLTRPQDHYKITITYQAPESLVLDHDYPADAFVLTNKWNLPEVDLDAKKTTPPQN
jgi:hypothetical protein